MSYAKEITLFCEICGNWERFQTGRVSTARKLSKKTLGWSYKDTQDICPECDEVEKQSGFALTSSMD
jgi:hypothetical protein